MALLRSMKVDLAPHVLTDVAPCSSISSSIVCVVNGITVEIPYVITSLLLCDYNNIWNFMRRQIG